MGLRGAMVSVFGMTISVCQVGLLKAANSLAAKH